MSHHMYLISAYILRSFLMAFEKSCIKIILKAVEKIKFEMVRIGLQNEY